MTQSVAGASPGVQEEVGDPPVYMITLAEYRMRLVAGWIDNFWREHRRAPTLLEIAARLGFSSKGSTAVVLDEMRRHGFVTSEPRRKGTREAQEGPPLGVVRRPRSGPHPRIDGAARRRAAAGPGRG